MPHTHTHTHTHTHPLTRMYTHTLHLTHIHMLTHHITHHTPHTHSLPSTMQVIAMAPSHESWQRNRPAHHGGAQRSYSQPPTPRYGRTSPPFCEYCSTAKHSTAISHSAGPTVGNKPLPMLPPPPHTSLLLGPELGMDLLDEIDYEQNKGILIVELYM